MSTKTETLKLQPIKDKSPGSKKGDDDSSEDYDPHLHRQVDKPTNNFETLVHLLKCSLGTGILAMPQAFAKSGLITGVIATVVVGIICTYCLHLLVKTQYKLCKRSRVPLLTYTESMAVALNEGPPSLRKFSYCSAVAVDIFLIVYQLGICCVYVVFIAKNLQTLCNPYIELAVEIHMLIILGPLIAINCIRNLKLLAPWSTAANVMTFVGLAIVVYYLLTGKKSHQPLDYWGSIYTFPLFFGTILFALTAVGVVVALENNMESPKSFGKPCGVLNIGMGIIIVLYIGVGIIGYVFCVSECSDSITLDLPTNPLASLVMILFTLAIFISYGLQCYVPVEVVWKNYLKPRLDKSGANESSLLKWEYAMRILLCLLTFIVAVVVPRLGLFISLFGAFCLSALGFIFPAIMEFCISFPDKYGPLKLRLLKDVFIFIFGLTGLIVGTYTALLAIVRSFQTPT